MTTAPVQTPVQTAGPRVSLEVFPPKTPDQDLALTNAMRDMGALNPAFMSVTCGAGGSTRVQTYATVRRIKDRLSVAPAAHVTGQGHDRGSLAALAQDYKDAGVRHIVALRGDTPKDAAAGSATALDALAVIDAVRAVDDFEISVAAYPEGHPKAASPEADMDALKAKADAGATRAITQFFFDADVFLRFRDRCASAGVGVPIVPGILPIADFAKARRMAEACGASVPDRLAARFERARGLPEIERQLGLDEAVALCGRLDHEGVEAFHIYTLNRAEAAAAICRSLGIRRAA
jgi:methylenetetrahydrofolate reductase (NADPH)